MKTTALQQQMICTVRQLLDDLEAGNKPSNPAVERAVREQVQQQMVTVEAKVADILWPPQYSRYR